MQVVPGNSYGHKIYHIRAIHEDAIGQSGALGDQHKIAIVHPDGKVFQVKAIKKSKPFPSLLPSEENKRRLMQNAGLQTKLLELNAIEDDAVFSKELLALACGGDLPGHEFHGNQYTHADPTKTKVTQTRKVKPTQWKSWPIVRPMFDEHGKALGPVIRRDPEDGSLWIQRSIDSRNAYLISVTETPK